MRGGGLAPNLEQLCLGPQAHNIQACSSENQERYRYVVANLYPKEGEDDNDLGPPNQCSLNGVPLRTTRGEVQDASGNKVVVSFDIIARGAIIYTDQSSDPHKNGFNLSLRMAKARSGGPRERAAFTATAHPNGFRPFTLKCE